MIAKQKTMIPLMLHREEDALDVVVGERAAGGVGAAMGTQDLSHFLVMRPHEVAFGAKVIPEVALSDADSGGNLRKRRARVALVVEEPTARVENSVARCGAVGQRIFRRKELTDLGYLA